MINSALSLDNPEQPFC